MSEREMGPKDIAKEPETTRDAPKRGTCCICGETIAGTSAAYAMCATCRSEYP
ncbi:hypothetical protein [Streptomyces purpureus]|uniref:hypothetical protein n=1 Tax=Streptomyces purpureus TaxID=1951 RepID=UPI00037276C4|nr:hypothetical protein [Streptomyces purpureus]